MLLGFPTRIWIGCMVFCSTFLTYGYRVHFSISILAMIDRKETLSECQRNGYTIYYFGEKLDPVIKKNITLPKSPEEIRPYMYNMYDWDELTQGYLLAAYFGGNILVRDIGATIAQKGGPYRVILFSTALEATFNLCLVFSVTMLRKWYYCFIFRFLMGMVEGIIHPGVEELLHNWVPPMENRYFALAFTGNTIGVCVIWPVVGVLTQYVGWESGFYLMSILSCLFIFIFFFLGADTPAQHWWITEEELYYITKFQENVIVYRKPPYFQILLSGRFWALAAAQIGNLWGLYLLIVGMPKYLMEVFGFDFTQIGWISCLPYIGRLFFGIFFAYVGDYLRASGRVSTTAIRKSFTTFSHLIPSICLALSLFTYCKWIPLVGLIAIAHAMNGALSVTTIKNSSDLSPNYAKFIYKLVTFIGNLTGILVPITNALFIQQTTLKTSVWTWVFLTGSLMYVTTGMIFICFGSGQRQRWDDIGEREVVMTNTFENSNII